MAYFKFLRPLRNQRDINLYLLRNYKFELAIDVGANKGLYSLELEKISNEVIIFEPLKKMFKDLEILLKKKTKKFNYALGNSFSNKKIKIPILSGSLSYGRASLTNKFKKYKSKIIKVRKLDYLSKKKKIYKNNKKVDFIKIDVEGYELNVIQGAKNLIKRDKPIILIELELRILGNKKIKRIFNFFNKLNYNVYYTDNGKNFKSTNFNDLKNFQKNSYFKKDILLKRRLKKGEKRYYISNFWFMPKNKNI